VARLLTSGFEWNDFGLGDPFGVPGSGTSMDTAVVRTGTYSLKVTYTPTTTVSVSFTFTGATAVTYYLRTYLQLNAYPSVNQFRYCNFRSGAGGSLGRPVYVDTTGALFLADTSGNAVSGLSDVLPLNVWARIELSLVIDSTNQANDYTELRLDGKFVASVTGGMGTTLPGSVVFGYLGNVPSDSNAAMTLNVEDVALNDSTGANENTWPGDGAIVLLKPVSDNARTGFAGGAGGTTNLFDAVNNLPPVGVADTGTNTSQIRDATSSATDNYDANMTDYTTAGVPAGATIKVVQWAINHGTASATSVPARAGRLVSNPAEGADTTLTAPTAAAGTYPSNWIWSRGSPIYLPAVTLGTSPVLRVGKRTSSTRVVDVDAMGIYVEFAPRRSMVAPMDRRRQRNPALGR
jgi:hypothetical protein